MIFCWRGGLRSRAIAEVLDLMGISCYRIDGGYKAYRSYVNIYYKKSELPQTFIVLYGLTGTGKTQIIQKLTERNWPAIDLEGLANHRGSVFGSIGLGSQPAQKWFESQLLANLKQFEQSKVLIVEGESRRIGKIFIPETVYQGMQNGKRILIYDEMGNRVRRLMDDYTAGADNNLEEIANSLNFLQRRLGKNKVKSLQILLQNNDLKKVATSLLDDYYDVLYHHPDHPDSDYDLSVDSSDLDLAIKRIEEYVHHLILNWGD